MSINLASWHFVRFGTYICIPPFSVICYITLRYLTNGIAAVDECGQAVSIDHVYKTLFIIHLFILFIIHLVTDNNTQTTGHFKI